MHKQDPLSLSLHNISSHEKNWITTLLINWIWTEFDGCYSDALRNYFYNVCCDFCTQSVKKKKEEKKHALVAL